MTLAIPSRQFRVSVAGWRSHLALLGGVAALLLLLFAHDAGDLARLWWTSTTFGHCLFLPPIIAWLVWNRRTELAGLEPTGWWPGLTLVGVGGLGWLLGDAAGVAFARHLGLVIMLQGAVLGLLGPQVARGLLFPLGYALFLVPFGEELEAPLQDLTVALSMGLLHLAGVPASVDGVLIHLPNGSFEVAEACSGTKFVIAMLAYGTLAAHLCFTGWRRRAGFMALALIAPILANGLRAFGTIYAAWLTSVEAATGFDHIVYGWLFFGLVMAAVLAIAWPWFDRDPDAPAFDPDRLRGHVPGMTDARVTAPATVALAAMFVSWSTLAGAAARPLPPLVPPVVPGWAPIAPGTRAPWTPHFPGADRRLLQRYTDGRGHAVDLALIGYAGQREGRELVAFGQGAIRENDRWVRVEDVAPLAGARGVRMALPGGIERETLTWYRVSGVITGDERTVKLLTARARLLGGEQSAHALLLSAEQVRPGQGRAAVQLFLDAAGPVDRLFPSGAR